MKTSIKKYIPFIFVGILILLIIAGYFFIWPKFQEFKQKKEEIETKDEEIRKKEEYLLNLENLSKELANYEDEIIKIDLALPSKPSVAAIFNYLQKTSSQNGLILKDIDISRLFPIENLTGEKIKKMPFSISITGSYVSFKNFIWNLYKNTRLIEIKSIDFSSNLDEDSELFDFNLDIETHAYSPFYRQESIPIE